VVDRSVVRVVTLVRFRSRLSGDEIKSRYPKRLPEFRAVPGLVQKYYVYDATSDEWGGLYLWDSEESVEAYVASDLRKTIPSFYEVEGLPRVETLKVFDVLR